MKSKKVTRRGLLAAMAVFFTGGVFFWRRGETPGLTPQATEGPFYPTPAMRMADVDNDLVKVMKLARKAGGEVFTLKGRITDKKGNPHAGLRIEIWQTDMNGKYLHPNDTSDMIYDQGFQGFGHDITGPDGTYAFRTIKPGKYPGRTEHIHVKVFKGSREILTTQFYEANNPNNADDDIFEELSDAQAKNVSMIYRNVDDGEEALVNIMI